MKICLVCNKHPHQSYWSRHKKGSSGASGTWALKAQVHIRTVRPNLHTFKGNNYCTKCLRMVKAVFNTTRGQKYTPAVVTPPTAS